MRHPHEASRAAPTSGAIHLFNGFQNPYGGSELEALSLYALLQPKADVRLWATSSKASKDLLTRFPIKRIAIHKGAFPRGGTYIFVGAHWRNKVWPYVVPKPQRLIYIYNTFHPKIVALTSNMPPLLGWPSTKYVVISAFQGKQLKLQPEVHPSPIDIDAFDPAPRPRRTRLVIGRLSRDTPDKHHPDDVPLYKELAGQGFDVRLQGARCLSNMLSPTDGVHLSPIGDLPAHAFLASLDIFYYRTHTHVETFGRVVFEAMACGLPVVCHSHGGYADWIRHGENGFLFDTTEEAKALLMRLAKDAELRARVGAEARNTVEDMYSAGRIEERLAFYLG